MFGYHDEPDVVLMMFGMLLLAAVLVGAVLLVLRGRTIDTGAARAVLDERFARGELDIEEYRRRRDVLRSDR